MRTKEQQVHELMVRAGKFSNKDPAFSDIMKPIVPCDVQFHYRNSHFLNIYSGLLSILLA